MADSTPSSLAERTEQALQLLLRLPPDQQAAVIEGAAHRLPLDVLGPLSEKIAAANRRRQRHIGQEDSREWVTLPMLLKFAPDRESLVNHAWNMLLKYGLKHGMEIRTYLGSPWNHIHERSSELSERARIGLESFLAGIEAFEGTRHQGVGSGTSGLLLAFAEHHREQQS